MIDPNQIDISGLEIPDRRSAVERNFANQPIETYVPSSEIEDEGGVDVDSSGRIEIPDELKPVEDEAKQTAPSVFVTLKIVSDEKRAAALATLLRGKTPEKVIKTREGKGGKKFRYVEGWYVKQMLNALFAMQWDFELMPIKEEELFYMNAMQVIVLGKLTIRDTDGIARIVKMGVGKKEISYLKDEHGKRSSIPVDLGNEVKAAETDALKRCATSLGIALDLYQND